MRDRNSGLNRNKATGAGGGDATDVHAGAGVTIARNRHEYRLVIYLLDVKSCCSCCVDGVARLIC
jgi:hypothetical protein